MKRLLLVGFSAVLLVAFVASPASAGRMDQYTISHLTFSAPVKVPGVMLPAGTYTFWRLGPNLIRVLSENHSIVYTTFMTIPRLRSERTVKQEVVFGEAVPGVAPEIAVWYPFPEPSWYNFRRSVGFEPLYPESRAVPATK